MEIIIRCICSALLQLLLQFDHLPLQLLVLNTERGNLSLSRLVRSATSCCVFILKLLLQLAVLLLELRDAHHILILHRCQLRVHIGQLLVKREDLFGFATSSVLILRLVVLSRSFGLKPEILAELL